MITRQGDVFTTDAYYIAHGVNVDGVMGAGIAKTIREKFPTNYWFYKDACSNGTLKPGGLVGKLDRGKVILNLATQDRPGANARYEWVFESMLRAATAVNKDKHNRKAIAIPQIGCGIGGLSWSGVRAVIFAVEAIVPDVSFEVWEYKP